jgi:hypothetical protein
MGNQKSSNRLSKLFSGLTKEVNNVVSEREVHVKQGLLWKANSLPTATSVFVIFPGGQLAGCSVLLHLFKNFG